ncbi:hypothetical protein B0H15DRAFT_788739 [Mycena belliarum]|uniref:Uncharacterized protein n=1 Tax=Mycena belliarum TaxID=1033014 RepID=A0AAD6XPI4_9AGAR|nr:hypothetical protein B0H15DRAFT_788739 [Mycena belliae]
MTPIIPSSSSASSLRASQLPAYSARLPCGERMLLETPRIEQRDTGTYSRACGRETLILYNQTEGMDTPVYRRAGRISGAVAIKEAESISNITVQLRGSMEVTLRALGCTTKRILRERRALWAVHGPGSACPATLPFSFVLPLQFRDENQTTRPLPPTCTVTLPGFFMKIDYSVCINVARSDPQFQGFSIDKTMSVPFHYRSGYSTSRIPTPSRRFLHDIKTIPEEWRQISLQSLGLADAGTDTINVSLFLPSATMINLQDAIPFHVQLTGRASWLRHFRAPPGDSGSQRLLKCYIQRDIVVNMHGRPSTRSIKIGRENLSTCSPPRVDVAPAESETALDWSGELRCDRDVLVGSFDAGLIKLQVRHTNP